MHIEQELKLDFKDVLIRPKRSTLGSRSEVDISREFIFRNSGVRYTGIPIIAANMDTTGTFEMARALDGFRLSVALHKHYGIEEYADFFRKLERKSAAFYSMGITKADHEKFHKVMEQCGSHIEFVCIDVANGYTETFAQFVRKIRAEYPKMTIMAGNVVTGEMTEELILSGADIVKVGIGPGSVCTTRKMTGVGYPQLSATIECADAAHGLGGHICTDGGITVPGDLAKAFGGGADFIMMGGMFAGHEETSGETITREGAQYKRFYGMSSKEVLVPYKGRVEDTLQDILGGVRSACTYVGARRLKELSKRTTFIRVTQQLNEVFGKS
jgi:GMP reductase